MEFVYIAQNRMIENEGSLNTGKKQKCQQIANILRRQIFILFFVYVVNFGRFKSLRLRLHYVPGSHGSPKRSSQRGFGHFSSSVTSRYVFPWSIKVSVTDR